MNSLFLYFFSVLKILGARVFVYSSKKKKKSQFLAPALIHKLVSVREGVECFLAD